ncbi:hypothetical protein PM10SUCC1_34430 [Propionigenium maris DSM 9537]|uniref:HTH cro/C1-type domain-containing protein n=1 Tax=Propionigenium maris DSM 9537 TaxID=1123000 RepID=A0A9W6GPU8_9FUSO|nr:helix-turn-helix transcriptional regulator [Propionigenium maris]GLI57929.1 hypothetical protein PM10SUCC1_34430 [Propionigenium maris DSM 9537]
MLRNIGEQDLNNLFRRLLRDYRQRSGYSQREVASLLGMGQASICNFENGKNGITLEVATKLLTLFEKRIFITDGSRSSRTIRPLIVFYNDIIRGKYRFEDFTEFRQWLFKEFVDELTTISIGTTKAFDIIEFYERDPNGEVLKVKEPALTEEGEDLVILSLAKSSKKIEKINS